MSVSNTRTLAQYLPRYMGGECSFLSLVHTIGTNYNGISTIYQFGMLLSLCWLGESTLVRGQNGRGSRTAGREGAKQLRKVHRSRSKKGCKYQQTKGLLFQSKARAGESPRMPGATRSRTRPTASRVPSGPIWVPSASNRVVYSPIPHLTGPYSPI